MSGLDRRYRSRFAAAREMLLIGSVPEIRSAPVVASAEPASPDHLGEKLLVSRP
jgi:hypothetical protein